MGGVVREGWYDSILDWRHKDNNKNLLLTQQLQTWSTLHSQTLTESLIDDIRKKATKYPTLQH